MKKHMKETRENGFSPANTGREMRKKTSSSMGYIGKGLGGGQRKKRK